MRALWWMGCLVASVAHAKGEGPVRAAAKTLAEVLVTAESPDLGTACPPSFPSGGLACATLVERVAGQPDALQVGRVYRDKAEAIVRWDLRTAAGLDQQWWKLIDGEDGWRVVDAVGMDGDPHVLVASWTPVPPDPLVTTGTLATWSRAVSTARLRDMLMACTDAFVDARPGCKGLAASAMREGVSFVPHMGWLQGERGLVLYDQVVGTEVKGRRIGRFELVDGRAKLAALVEPSPDDVRWLREPHEP